MCAVTPPHSCSHICISWACCFSLHWSYAQAPTPQTIPPPPHSPPPRPPIEKTLTLGWLIQPLLTGSQTTQCSDGGGGGGGGWRRGKLREGDTLMSMPELSRSTRNNTNSQLRDTQVLRPLTQHTHTHAARHQVRSFIPFYLLWIHDSDFLQTLAFKIEIKKKANWHNLLPANKAWKINISI